MTARYLLTLTDDNARHLDKWLGSVLVIGPAHLQPMEAAAFVAGLDVVTDAEYDFIARRLRRGGPLYHAGGPSDRPEEPAADCDHVFFSGPPENQPPKTGELCLAGCQTARYTWADGTVTFTRGTESPA